MDDSSLQNVQRKMLRLLQDGKPHTVKELHDCLYDRLGLQRNIHTHLGHIRKLLRLHGQDVVHTVRDGVRYYYITRSISVNE